MEDPIGALREYTGDLAWATYGELKSKADASAFFDDDAKNIHEVRHFIVKDAAEKRKMESFDPFSPKKYGYGKELVSEGKAIELSEREYGRLMHENAVPWNNDTKHITESTQTINWDEDRAGKKQILARKSNTV